ncbi:MAG: helix-turn-helix transcriptional regulator [Acidobacteria bacterium]|nr:helix-turn-helix transcriptional regulator [Acidobacteriota bacterium]
MDGRTARFDVAALHAALDAQRRSCGLAWKDVADESGVSASTLTRLSQGRQPDVNSLAALTAWLGISADDFMRSERAERFGAPAPLAQISSIIHRDPNLNPEGVVALEEMIKATYARLRIDRRDHRPPSYPVKR